MGGFEMKKKLPYKCALDEDKFVRKWEGLARRGGFVFESLELEQKLLARGNVGDTLLTWFLKFSNVVYKLCN